MLELKPEQLESIKIINNMINNGRNLAKPNVSDPGVTVDLEPISSLLGSSADSGDQRHPVIYFTCAWS